jgi:RHS repeat-associated protein
MSGGSNTTGQVLYSYSMPNAGSFAPNGNLLNVADSVTGAWTYTYDNLNRLVGAAAVASALQGMENYYAGLQTSFGYDAFGNRTVMTQGGTPAHSVPSSSTAYYTASSNQVASMTYDAAGDVIYDGLNSYLYDAEGRLCAVRNYVGVLTGYLYDAAGTRVAKGSLATFSCNFAPTNFTPATSWVLGPGGEQVTEYAVSGGASAWAHTNAFSAGQLQATYHDTGTYLYLGDWLGTKRVEVGASDCISAYTGLPFGDGLTPVSVPGYASCPDATEHHFTGKERDTESGNDYFEARYYSSAMGRFMSPDPLLNSGRPDDPQTWNRYSYVLNNPLVGTDPTGLYNLPTNCGDDKTCAGTAANLKSGVTALTAAVNKLPDDDPRKSTLQASLKALGTENDGNNVNVQFGKTGDGSAAQTVPGADSSGKLNFTLTIDPKKNSWDPRGGDFSIAINAAHEGTHVADYGDPRYNTNTLSPFSNEYRGYRTSAYAASVFGVNSFSAATANGRQFVIWNGSWGAVDKNLTKFVPQLDKPGHTDHAVTEPHDPWSK